MKIKSFISVSVLLCTLLSVIGISAQNPGKIQYGKIWNQYLKSEDHPSRDQNNIPPANWEQKGNFSYSGRFISYAFDPQNLNTIYAGSASSGLWKSTDGGGSWQSIGNNIPSLAIGAISIDPSNSNNIIVGTGEGYIGRDNVNGVGVLHSIDGGQTWSQTSFNYSDSDSVQVIAFSRHPTDPNKVYLAATNGIWLSTNGGVNWVPKLSGVASTVLVDQTVPDGVYAAIEEMPSMNSVGGIFRSTNGGGSWQQCTTGLPVSNQTGFTSFAICDSFPFIVYALVSYPYPDGELQGIFQTKDGGNFWKEIPSPNLFCQQLPNDPTLCQGWYSNCIAISPKDSSVIYVGGINIYKTTDMGHHWDESDLCTTDPILGKVHPGQHQLAVKKDEEDTIYAFNDGGIYKSLNGGFTWDKKINGINTLMLYDIDAVSGSNNLMTCAAENNGIWKNTTVTQGTDWQQWHSGEGFATAIDPTNTQIYYATEWLQGRIKTIDGGQTFQNINNGISGKNTWLMPLAMDPSNSFTLFTATDSSIYKTPNGGGTWVDVEEIPNISVIKVDPNNSTIIYATDGNATHHLFRSSDSGASWDSIHHFSQPVTDIIMHPDSSGVIFVTTASYDSLSQIWRSNDFGQTWMNLSNNFPTVPANCLAIDPNDTRQLYAGSDMGVYISIDGGQTWNEWNDGLPNCIIKDILYHPYDRTVRVATYGRGYWQTNAADYTGIESPVSNQLDDVSLFPNPSHDQFQVSGLKLEVGQNFKVQIYNSLGEKIFTVVISTSNLKLQTSNYPAGIYFVKIETEGKQKILKLVVQ